MRTPSTNQITLGFGSTADPYSPASPHRGVDFGYLPDNRIYAPFSGRVTLVPNNGNDGNGVYMTEPNGRFHGLLHTSQYLVANGQYVNEGDPIAVMGATGFAQGVHLHWAVKQGGSFINGLSLLPAGQGAGEVNNDMITKDDTAIVRIIMSEVEGWNGNDIHSGKNDAQIMGAWQGRDFRDLIWNGWKVQGIKRQGLIDQLNATTAKLNEVSAQANLSAQLQKQVDDLNAKNQECVVQVTELKDQQVKDEETGKSFFRAIAQFLKLSK